MRALILLVTVVAVVALASAAGADPLFVQHYAPPAASMPGAAAAELRDLAGNIAKIVPTPITWPTPAVERISGVFGSPVTFATHAELASYGFAWGPSDGLFGVIPAGGGRYTFFGTAAATSSCTGTPNGKGAFTFAGTLDAVTGSNGCTRLFGPGDGPAGWVFDQDYAGGGQVTRFSVGGKSGWLMPFHAEVHWKNLANPPTYLCAQVPCFYSTLGLAVSTDNAKTFRVVGPIMQPSEPLSVFTGGGQNMAVGYGALLVADANGRHVDNPPANPSGAYFYLMFTDLLAGSPGSCAKSDCLGIARASYADVIAAALSGDPHQVARVFHKYDGASPDPWTEQAASDTPDLSGAAGTYAPLWTDEPARQAEVIYDRTFDVYLAVYQGAATGLKVRASSDLLHWTEPIGAPYEEAGRALYSPTFVGDTADPTIGGPAPRVYFSSFVQFPNWNAAIFESLPLTLSRGPLLPTPTPRHLPNPPGGHPCARPPCNPTLK